MKRQKNPFPRVNTVEDRHGKLRYRLRRTLRGCTVDTYLPGPYGSPEFRAAYEEACEGARLAEHGATEWEVMAFLAHREGGEPLHGGREPGEADHHWHGEAGGGTGTNIVQPSRMVGQTGSLTP